MNLGLSNRYAKTAVIAAALIAQPVSVFADAAAADPTGPFYERSFVLAADKKCRLFAPVLASALTASAWQARGAAVRAGAPDDVLKHTAERADAMAARTACSDPQLTTVRERVTGAFSVWSRMPRMTFPGTRYDWTANRSEFSSPSWRLMQTSKTGISPVTFGVSAGGGQAETLKAVVSFVGKSRPYAARIVMRNTERAPHAWLRNGVAALPPEASQQAFFAAGNTDAEATLLVQDKKQGQAWIFSTAAADALEGLDPREPFVIEFMFADDSVARATFEAGDFAAGRAFISMGSL